MENEQQNTEQTAAQDTEQVAQQPKEGIPDGWVGPMLALFALTGKIVYDIRYHINRRGI